MFAVAANLQYLFLYAGAAVLAAVVLGTGRAAMKLVQGRQTERRNEDQDQRTLSEFFFDTPRNERTGTPAKIGWTTKVDKTLETLTQQQNQTTHLLHQAVGGLNEVLGELKPDGNGGHNLRGIIERGIEAAGVEVTKQTNERERVQDRDDHWDHS